MAKDLASGPRCASFRLVARAHSVHTVSREYLVDIDVIRGTNDKPGASHALEEFVRSWTSHPGKGPSPSDRLYIGYPPIGTADGSCRIDALLASKVHGLLAFDLIETGEFSGYQGRQDSFANAIEYKLRSHQPLVRRANGRRELRVPVHALSFAPAVASPPTDDDYPIENAQTLSIRLDALADSEWDQEALPIALSVLDSMSTIRKPRRPRPAVSAGSRGAKLRKLEDAMATLDTNQARAVIRTADGVQRIRGLAGSGKSIVLAQKAAYLHAMHPDWRIAVTFQTRALKDFFRHLIERSYYSKTSNLPNWDQLWITSAWGGSGGGERNGIYHEFCARNDVEYRDYRAARTSFGRSNAFAGACRAALEDVKKPVEHYDAILVDEAQDLPTDFLLLCYRSLKEQKHLVYAYDELQNLGKRSLPGPKEMFGPSVRWRHESPDSDVILKKCYRNPRPILATAHALGFGIHREHIQSDTTGIVQMFDDSAMWRDVGYQSSGSIHHGEFIAFERTEATSPAFLEEHSKTDDLVVFADFDKEDMQTEWLVREIEKNLDQDDLTPEDIVVINLDPLSTPKATGPMRARLMEKGIQSHLAGVSTEADEFRRPDSVMFTGIYRAKGNEFGMVYVVNAQDCYSADFGLARLRNMLFSAITRSKAWVRVAGIGEDMRKLSQEHAQLKANEYRLKFRYPTKAELDRMRVVHRDMSREGADVVKEFRSAVRRFGDNLDAGEVYLEDVEDLRPALERLLAVRERKPRT